jgi:hypothetical protein
MLSTQRKRLTRRATGHNVDLIGNERIIESSRIDFKKRPSLNSVRVMALILSKCLACSAIPLDNRRVTKPYVCHSNR